MSEFVIETRSLTKRYGDRTAVDHLDFTVERGEVFGLLGPNGAGKTTTILMLLGLTAPTEGWAKVAGLDPLHEALEVRTRVGYLPDAVGFDDHLTGRQNLRYTARLNRLPDVEAEQRIERLTTEVALDERIDDKVGTYSRGMRQRLGIADALLKDPQVLVLDEPTTAIDPEGVRDILALIRALPERTGCTVLLASHLLHQVQAVCDRVGIFVDGQLKACGSVTELAAQHAGTVTFEVDATGDGRSPVQDVLAQLADVVEVRRDESGVWLVFARRDVREDASRALVADGWVPVHLHRRADELTDVYHQFFVNKDKHDDDHIS